MLTAAAVLCRCRARDVARLIGTPEQYRPGNGRRARRAWTLSDLTPVANEGHGAAGWRARTSARRRLDERRRSWFASFYQTKKVKRMINSVQNTTVCMGLRWRDESWGVLWKVDDSTDVTFCSSRMFHSCKAATRKVWSPMDEKWVYQTPSDDDEAELRCWQASTSDDLWNSSVRYDGAVNVDVCRLGRPAWTWSALSLVKQSEMCELLVPVSQLHVSHMFPTLQLIRTCVTLSYASVFFSCGMLLFQLTEESVAKPKVDEVNTSSVSMRRGREETRSRPRITCKPPKSMYLSRDDLASSVSASGGPVHGDTLVKMTETQLLALRQQVCDWWLNQCH